MRNASFAPQSTSDRLATVLSYGALLLLGYLVFRIFQPFLVPLAWSAVLAIFFYPLYERLLKRMPAKRAALVSTLAVTFLLIVPALLVLFYTARQGLEASARFQTSLAVHGQGPDQGFLPDVEAWLRNRLPASMQSVDIEGQLQQGVEKFGSFVAGSLGALLKNFANFFVNLFLMIFTLFFMFRDGQSVVRALRHLMPFDDDIQREMMKESRELILASVAVALVIAGIQGLLGGTAFAIARISTPIFWGVVIAFFSVVPVVGSALIWLPCIAWLFFTGHWGKALVVAVICGGVSTVADNIVRPLLLSNRTRLNDLLVFIGVIGGLEVFGLLGLVAGPTILAAAMGVFRVYMDRRDELLAPSP
ncbi:MAG: AI-2E family transporter [Candidatus Acidiferrum sp.]|jgi:predicted PurR-regulated permease PerM